MTWCLSQRTLSQYDLETSNLAGDMNSYLNVLKYVL